MEFLITVLIAVILLVGVVSSCPSVCSCTDNSVGVDVTCHNRGLNSIPTDLPNNTSSLRLEGNNISVIEDNAFNNLPILRHLYLHSNQITSIQSGTFNDLQSLTILFLSFNQITSIQSGIFNDLQSLTQLHLNHNQITSIQSGTFNDLQSLTILFLHSNKIASIQSGSFNNLTSLTYINLHNNQIASIQSGSFNNLTSLTILNLHNNQIASIQSGSFYNLTSLTTLRMENNNITFVSGNAFVNLPQLPSLEFDMHCGSCDNIPFWRWLKGKQTFTTSITCNDFDGEHLSNVQLNSVIDCFDRPQTPVNFSLVSSTDTTILVEWTPRYNDSEHTFYLEYRVRGAKTWSLKEISHNTKQLTSLTYVLSGLQDSTLYELKMYSKNMFGRSLSTDIDIIQTREKQDKETSSSGLYAAIVGMAGVLTVSIIIVIILGTLLYRRKKGPKEVEYIGMQM